MQRSTSLGLICCSLATLLAALPPSAATVIKQNTALNLNPTASCKKYCVQEDFPDFDTDTVTVTLPAAKATHGLLFGRRRATLP